MKNSNAHKTQSPKERGSDLGIAILISIMRITGPRFVKILVVPVAFYYFLTSSASRKASNKYFEHLKNTYVSSSIKPNLEIASKCWFAYRHILSFAQSMVDRVCTWIPDSQLIEYQVDGMEIMDSVLGEKSNGGIIFVSHLGNFDLAIARKNLTPDKHFIIVMDTRQTQTYNKYRDKLFQSGQVSFLAPDSLSPIRTMELIEQVNSGDIVVIAADRIQNPDNKNSVMAEFMGSTACFPSGPYILAHLLEVPVYVLFALQKKEKCLIRFEQFEKKIVLRRKSRAEDIKKYAEKFASRLQRECLESPLQWYNFYDFWAQSETRE